MLTPGLNNLSFVQIALCCTVKLSQARPAKCIKQLPGFSYTNIKLVFVDQMTFQSPDVELVEPEAVLVKEEKRQVEETEEDIRLIGDDG